MTDRYIDLLRQGFMRPRKAKRAAEPAPIVACERCRNWHTKGKHTARRSERQKIEPERQSSAASGSHLAI